MTEFPRHYLLHLLEQIRANTVAGVLAGSISVLSIPATLTQPNGVIRFYLCAVGAASSVAAKKLLGIKFELEDTLTDLKNVNARQQIGWYTDTLNTPEETPMHTMLTPNDKPRDLITDLVAYWQEQDKHLMLVGGTGDGKSTLVKGLVQVLDDWRFRAYDVDFAKGDYPLEVSVLFTYPAIENEMRKDMASLEERYAVRREAGANAWGERPSLIIAEEMPSLAVECESEPQWIRLIAKRGRKVKMFLACCVQNDTIENTGLKGDNSLRDSSFVRIYLGKFAAERAKKLDRPELTKWLSEKKHGRFIVDDRPCEWVIESV